MERGFLHLKMDQLEPEDFLCKLSDWPSRSDRFSLVSGGGCWCPLSSVHWGAGGGGGDVETDSVCTALLATAPLQLLHTPGGCCAVEPTINTEAGQAANHPPPPPPPPPLPASRTGPGGAGDRWEVGGLWLHYSIQENYLLLQQSESAHTWSVLISRHPSSDY